MLFGLYLDKRRHLILDEPFERALCALTGAREQAASETKSDDSAKATRPRSLGQRDLFARLSMRSRSMPRSRSEKSNSAGSVLSRKSMSTRANRASQVAALSRATCAQAAHELRLGRISGGEPEAVSTGDLRVLRLAERLALRAREELAGHGLIRRTGTVLPTPYAAA